MYFEDKQNNVSPKELLLGVAIVVLMAWGAIKLFSGDTYSPCAGAKCPTGTIPIKVKTGRYSTSCACGPASYED